MSSVSNETGLDLDSLTPEIRELFQTDIKEYFYLMQLYNAAIKEVRTKLEILDEEFSVRYAHNPIHHMEYRLKNPRSILGKLKRKNLPIRVESMTEHLYDIAGVRVICNYIEDVYRVAQLLTSQDDITLVRCRDYIKTPKANGYRSLHLVVSIPIFLAERTAPVPVEVQIRTIAMDFWASLDHQLRYKSEELVPADLKERLRQCAETITALDNEMQAIYKELKEGLPKNE